jgi:hypothetical protein
VRISSTSSTSSSSTSSAVGFTIHLLGAAAGGGVLGPGSADLHATLTGVVPVKAQVARPPQPTLVAVSGTHVTMTWPLCQDASWYNVRMASIGRKREKELGGRAPTDANVPEVWFEPAGAFRMEDRSLKALDGVARAAVVTRVYCGCFQVQAGDGEHGGAWSEMLVVKAKAEQGRGGGRAV